MSCAAVRTLLDEVLCRVRIRDSMQFCFVPAGDWQTDDTPASFGPKDAIGFHILASGACWLEAAGRRIELRPGDVAAFPFGMPHRLGAGAGGIPFDPARALPPAPWTQTPVLRVGQSGAVVRLLCGHVCCDAMQFAPFREALPDLVHLSTADGGDWLGGVIAQIVDEVDAPRGAGSAVLERLSEVILLEVLRRQLLTGGGREFGWLAAIRDPLLGRCLALIHEAPTRHGSLGDLARGAGASRSVLAARFRATLGRAPIAYIREWRLFLARERLRQGRASISAIASDAGYASDAAFTRAFARTYGVPPATFRDGPPAPPG